MRVSTTARLRLSQVSLIFVPVAIGLGQFAPERHVLVCACAALAVLPLAAAIGRSTSTLADQLGGGIGGLLNATFGNAVELIIGVLALKEGLPDLVKASLTGSIIGNVLFVFGASAFLGGLRHPVQKFNRTAAGIGTTMLLLSAVGLVVPAVFHSLVRGTGQVEMRLDTEIAVVLLATYLISLIFTLRTHRGMYGRSRTPSDRGDGRQTRRALLALAAATIAVGIVSEFLVAAVTDTAKALGLTQLFVGVVVVAIIGNAAEHLSALQLAARDEMDAAMAIAVGSSTQIALFVATVLALASYVVGPTPMDLLFTTFELVAVGISVFSIAFIAHDGETNWLEGIQLLAVYAILALGFYFLPETGHSVQP